MVSSSANDDVNNITLVMPSYMGVKCPKLTISVLYCPLFPQSLHLERIHLH